MCSSSPILSPRQELDKISQLPDDIVLKVLSTLDFKNAVQTSILAKRWRYLWTWMTVLDFDPANLSPDNYGFWISKKIRPQGYLNWVNQVVDAHRGSCIRKFRVFFKSKWSNDKSQVKRWTIFAFSKKVEELDLKLSFINDSSRFSLGFDILKHPLSNGIINLKSLRLSSVDLSGETLEFILLQCHLLEQLYVDNSHTLHTLNIVSYNLKHLSLIQCIYLKELEINAVNLISFHLEDDYRCVHTHMVFNRVPKLIEVSFAGKFCWYPFRILEQISYLPKQLTKLSFWPTVDCCKHFATYGHFHTPVEIDVVFSNVKQLTLTATLLHRVLIKFFINACPMLHELKLQVELAPLKLKEESEQLREIELEDERNDKMSMDQNSSSEAQKENVEHEDENNKRHPNLKVLEVVGFHGCFADVRCVLRIIALTNSFETLICDPRRPDVRTSGINKDIEKIETIKRRARKLAKLLPPKAHVAIRDKSNLFWLS